MRPYANASKSCPCTFPCGRLRGPCRSAGEFRGAGSRARTRTPPRDGRAATSHGRSICASSAPGEPQAAPLDGRGWRCEDCRAINDGAGTGVGLPPVGPWTAQSDERDRRPRRRTARVIRKSKRPARGVRERRMAACGIGVSGSSGGWRQTSTRSPTSRCGCGNSNGRPAARIRGCVLALARSRTAAAPAEVTAVITTRACAFTHEVISNGNSSA